MTEKKSKDRFGTGVKRIYFVLCGIFGWFLLKDIISHAECLNGEYSDLCWMRYGEDELSGTIVTHLIMFLATIPFYYIIRWIYLGFKK